jgi:hypothetical protein
MVLDLSAVCAYGDLPIVGNGELIALANGVAPTIDYLSLGRCYAGGNVYLYQVETTSDDSVMGVSVTVADSPALYPTIEQWDYWFCNPQVCDLPNITGEG